MENQEITLESILLKLVILLTPREQRWKINLMIIGLFIAYFMSVIAKQE
jgi:hypothetical protein